MASEVRAVADRNPDPRLRIGELSRRVGVRPETLRAWERRYSLLEPARSDANYRLYSAADEARVRTMTSLLARGASAAEAARLAREPPIAAGETGPGANEAGRVAHSGGAAPAVPPAPEADAGGLPPASAARPVIAEAVFELVEAVAAFDDQRAHALCDRVLGRFSLATAIGDFFLPVLAEIGDRWSRGELTIGQEHFGAELLRGRLLGLARGWGSGRGPLVLLACPPRERHDLGLISFGLAIRELGWRIAYLGADTPLPTLSDTADRLEPDAIVVAAIDPARFEAPSAELRRLAEHHALIIAGAGANVNVAQTLGAAHLGGGPVLAARWVAEASAPV